jgi:hypothetical protein
VLVIDQMKTFSMSEEESMKYVTILQDTARYFAVSKRGLSHGKFCINMVCVGNGID